MAIYPSTPRFIFDGEITTKKEALRSESEAGYTMSRPRYTKAKKSFTLNYSAIKNEDYAILEAFFEANQGLNFTFTHPIDLTKSYTVIFAMDELKAKPVSAGRCSTTVELREV